jgi:transposase
MSAMNELNVNLQHSILALSANGWSRRRIARELGIDRETVGKYLLLAEPKPAISTPGSEPGPDSKPAISTAGSSPGRQSLCEPYSPLIEAAAAVGLSAQRIYQDLVSEHSFSGSYQAVKRFVRHLRQAQPVPFVRMEVNRERKHRLTSGRAHGSWWMANANAPISFGWS